MHCQIAHIAMVAEGAYLVPWASSALSREGRRDPRILVGPVPNSDTDTARDGHTRRDDGVVVGLLLGEQGGCRGERHADVELRDGHLEAESGETLPVGREA